DRIAQIEYTLALFGEKRVAENHVRPIVPIAELRELVDDVANRSDAVAGENPVRAVGAKFRTAAAREQRQSAADGTRRPLDAVPPIAIAGDQIPARKRQRIEIADRFRGEIARRDMAPRQAHHARFGLAVQNEIGMI